MSGHYGDGEGGVQRDRLALATGVALALNVAVILTYPCIIH